MSYSYIAYIDESGDHGLARFRDKGSEGGASSWLLISACVFRYSYDVECVAWRDEILAEIPKKKSPKKKTRYLHFAHLDHQQKVFAAKSLAEKKVRTISILSNKRTIQPGTYKQNNQLYFYLVRYLSVQYLEIIGAGCAERKWGWCVVCAQHQRLRATTSARGRFEPQTLSGALSNLNLRRAVLPRRG
jgi:hypothetical protein